MKRSLALISLFLACLLTYTPAYSQPSTGTWDSDSANFDPGQWYEILMNGQEGMEGNELGAESPGVYLFSGPKLARVDQIREPNDLNGFFEYLTFYSGGKMHLYNGIDLPWYNADSAQDDFVFDLNVSKVVTKEYVGENGGLMDFFITTSAVLEDDPSFSAVILAKYTGTPMVAEPGSDGGNNLIMTGALQYVKIAIDRSTEPPPSGNPSDFAVDIKPGSCVNPVNVKSKGYLPVAILGSAEFDVSRVDPDSVMLNGVSAARSAVEDIGMTTTDDPYCDDNLPDGFDDLVIKFNTQKIVASLGEDIHDGDVLELELTWSCDGIPYAGTDRIVIKKKKPKKNRR
jgi:hypothetical protein